MMKKGKFLNMLSLKQAVREDEERGEWVVVAAGGGWGIIEYLQLDWT